MKKSWKNTELSKETFFLIENSPLHVGKSAIFDSEEICLFAGYLIRLNFSDELIDSSFLNYYLNAPSTRQYGYSVMSSSVNQSNINGTKLKSYPFFKIDLDSQKIVSNKLESIEKQISYALKSQEAILNEYSKLKAAILAKELQSSEAA